MKIKNMGLPNFPKGKNKEKISTKLLSKNTNLISENTYTFRKKEGDVC